jgi:uncharacterized membrane protein YqaE (UPF0057 family)
MIAVAVLMPWLVLLLRGQFLQAALCLALQLTLIGWIPAAIWAARVVASERRERRYREMLRLLHGR